MEALLTGRVAVVTGGTSGIGRATAVEFARQGAKVVIAGRRESEGAQTVRMIEEIGGEASFIQTDVSISEDVENLIRKAIELYERIDCAFNNAGYAGIPVGLTKTAEDEFDKIISTNLRGTFLCLKHEIAVMMQHGGAIVNAGSINGLAASPGTSAYSATKGGIIAMSRTAALEYARFRIRINVVSPGAIATDMLAPLPDESLKRLARAHPLGRLGTAQEVAKVAVWLCSDRASYVLGQNIMVDGGYTAQ